MALCCVNTLNGWSQGNCLRVILCLRLAPKSADGFRVVLPDTLKKNSMFSILYGK